MYRAEQLNEVIAQIRMWKDLFVEFSGLQGHNKNILNISFASWRNFPLFSAHKIQGNENKTLITRTKKKSANQKYNVIFLSRCSCCSRSRCLKSLGTLSIENGDGDADDDGKVQ